MGKEMGRKEGAGTSQRAKVAFQPVVIDHFFKDFVYLFMRDRERETERERGRDTGRGRSRLHTGSQMWDSIPGLQDHALSRNADTQPLSHPGVP